jgi:hypothetical protein
VCAAHDGATCTAVFDDVRTFATSRYRSVAIKNDGTVWAFGGGNNGSVGDGTAEDRHLPVRVCTAWDTGAGACTAWLDGADAVVLAEHHAVVRRGGTLWMWGANWSGQLGDGCGGAAPCADSLVARQVGTGTDWSAIAAGSNHTVALKTDGTLWSWGSNYAGVLGDGGAAEFRSTPAPLLGLGQVAESDWAAVAAGSQSSYAVKADGRIFGWGDNRSGQLGIGGSDQVRRPLRVPQLP